jgi:division protein CdvB (Snf7/Vps24/ESCRT-III family)
LSLRKRKSDPRISASRALQSLRVARMHISKYTRRLQPAAQRDEHARTLLELLYKLDYLLEWVSLKLEVYIATGLNPSRTLGIAAHLLREAASLEATAPPEVLAEIMEAEENILQAVNMVSPSDAIIVDEYEAAHGSLNNEALRVLEEAEREARRRLAERLGEA